MNTLAHREEELFDAARKLKDPAKRAAFLEFSCEGELALRTRIESLLTAQDAAEGFFEESATALGPLSPDDMSAAALLAEETVGSRIGRYKLLEKLGEGGCGVVYLAEQEEPVRRLVALKIIRVGMETKSVIARFEAERQALAMMDHPNIARVFDAGATERGSPYFVMEHVQGVRITTYCDQHRLPVRQRLDLLVQICHAIQHAHQKGIVHGDIKPSNIMVTLHDGVPVPKVIDFGISKATEARLSERIPFSAYAQLIGTPAYMSPEQLDMGGLDVDTRSDIYSLGVLLYEMLTGRTPFDGKKLLESGLEQMRRTLRECDPARPSTFVGKLAQQEIARVAESRNLSTAKLPAMFRGDLDSIAMKALQRDRRRRYETANGLAMDIQRFLGDEPVLAHASSWLYRFRKNVRRNRVVFIAVAAVVAALVAGMGLSTWLFLKEREARQRAVEAQQRAVAAEQQQVRLREEAEVRRVITQAALLISQERLDEADALLSEVSLTQPTLEGASVFRSVGEWHAIHGRWKQACDRFAVLLRINQLDGVDVSSLDYLERGPALIELGDLAGYERFRMDAIARFSGSSNPFADRIVKISLLAAANGSIMDAIAPLAATNARSFAAAEAAGEVFEAAWRAMSLAFYEYRSGNYIAAADWSRRCLGYPEANAPRAAAAHAILAMSLHKLGRFDDARSELGLSRDLIDGRIKGRTDRGTPVVGFWFDWAFARILLRETVTTVMAPRQSQPHVEAGE